jgi:four helix bundle protein
MKRSYKDLDAWQYAFRLAKLIYKYTEDFPPAEHYRLVSQMCRAAVSITGNIAEGSCRGSDKDFVRFLYIARASAAELENYVLLSSELGYLTSQRENEINELIVNLGRTLNGLIRYLEQPASSLRPHKRQGTSDKGHVIRDKGQATRDM